MYYFYYLKIAKKELKGAMRQQFEENLKRNFRSYDYLCGFCDGYGFGKIEILPLDKIEKINNDENLQYLHHNYLYLVSVENLND